MSSKKFDISEFMEESKPAQPPKKSKSKTRQPDAPDAALDAAADADAPVQELDVQKEVVEQLAADNAELKEAYEKLKTVCRGQLLQITETMKLAANLARACEENAKRGEKDSEVAAKAVSELQEKFAASETRVAVLEKELADRLEKEFDEEEKRNPNMVALLDRDIEIPDRFPGETRDHVLEVLKEALVEAEKNGRYRRAKILEGVLLVNEPGKNLERRREWLKRLFEENGNLVTGAVISVLNKHGIAYRDGENYLMPKEIIDRTY